MAGEFPKVPDEAKTFNDLVDWGAKHGQGESIKQLVDAAQARDWDTALDAVHKMEDYAELAEKTAAVGKAFDTLDKVGKALEIAEAVERGDYEYAGAKLGAEVVDGVASDYLNSLGPGGMVLNYAVHQGGEYASGKLSEYQQFGPDAELAVASADVGAVGAYQATREVIDNGMQSRMEAGATPAEAREWAQQYMESHAGVWKNLEDFEAGGDAFKDRFEKDLDWIDTRSEAIGESLSDTPPTREAEGPGWLEGLVQRAENTLKDWADKAQQEQPEAEPVAASDPAPEPQEEVAEIPVEIQVADTTASRFVEAESVQAEVQQADPLPQDPLQPEPTPAEAVQAEAVRAEPVRVEPAQAEQTASPAQDAVAYEIPLTAPYDDEPPAPTPVAVDDSPLTETEKLDAYVSQMAREAEAQWAEEALADQAPPVPTEVVIDLTAEDEVVELAEPWDEYTAAEAYDDLPEDDAVA